MSRDRAVPDPTVPDPTAPDPAAPAEERLAAACDALRDGRPVLVADGTDREDEVDAVLSAERATEAWIAWTVRHTSGYLCAPLPAERADALDLPPMVARGEDPRGTAYTVAVDAAEGVSTGISAADRTRTLRVLADPAAGPGDLIRPGHVPPLRAAPGGVRERAGHTEAAVDLCRAAGLVPVGVIGELVHDHGPVMRREAAAALAREHELVLVTIAEIARWDLTAPSGRTEDGPALPADAAPDGSSATARVVAGAVADLPTRHGDFRVHAFRDRDTGAEHLALVPAAPTAPTADRPTAVRVHSECLTGEALGSRRCDCGPQLEAALALVAREGGVVVYLRGHEGRGIGLGEKIAAYALQDRGHDTVSANRALGHPDDAREYGAAAAILRHLGRDAAPIALLTHNPAKAEGLRAHGLAVTGMRPLLPAPDAGPGATPAPHPALHAYLRTKVQRMGHRLPRAPAAATRPGRGLHHPRKDTP